MSKFKSINYSRVVCEICNAETIIEPGREFSGLNCICDVEVGTQFKDIVLFIKDDEKYERLAYFDNGDVEVRMVDSDISYRIPLMTFEEAFKEDVDDITALRLQAKELGIPRSGNMKRETLIDKIEAHNDNN